MLRCKLQQFVACITSPLGIMEKEALSDVLFRNKYDVEILLRDNV